MQRRILSFSLIALFSIVFFGWGCSKLDTTDIGSDLIPAVDNVHTFDTLLTINATQGIFADSNKVNRAEDHVLGAITNDPLFGTTTANIYMQLKPTFYPYYFGNAKDTINAAQAPGTGFDSVVLCINYKGFWGDSTQLQQLTVKSITNNNGIWDSVYQDKTITYQPNTGVTIGTASVDIRKLGNYTVYRNKRDSSKNQIRIKLDMGGFANSIFTRNGDTSSPSGVFRTDSLFRLFQNGIAVIASGGNGLMYCSIADTNTKLEVHFRRKNGGTIDTAYSSFKLANDFLSLTNLPSSSANAILRNRVGASVSNPGANDIYLQATPGTYANLSIPALSTISNRIIHRAEIIIEQVYSPLLPDLTPPNYLYLDLKDTSTVNKWKPIYFDLNPGTGYDPDFTLSPVYFPTGGVDFVYFGGFQRSKSDVFGNPIKFYNINITRYVQQIVTRHTPNYQMRLFAPYNFVYPQYSNSAIAFANLMAFGRVRVGSGNNPNYRMRLRLVYSRI